MGRRELMLAGIEAFYDAALDEALWPEALRRMTELTGSQASSFWVLDGDERPRHQVFTYVNFDSRAVEEYLGHMLALDPTVRFLMANPHQRIVHDGLLTNTRDPHSREYLDWHERNVETRFRLVGQVQVAPGVQAGIALHRAPAAGLYDGADIQEFTLLYRHLERALAIGSRLGSLSAVHQFGAERLERSPAAVFLLDRRGHVVFSNRGAQALQAAADGFHASVSGLRLAHRAENERLQALIGAALPGAGDRVRVGGVMRASRPSLRRPYGIFVSVLSQRHAALDFLRPAVCVTITDADSKPPPPPDQLREVFSLSAAEARLASMLAAGEPLRAAAAKLRITYGTARERLASIFRKTGTTRQGELIRLLLTSLPE